MVIQMIDGISFEIQAACDLSFLSKYETWELSEALYNVALKAVSPKRECRYASIKLFYDDWKTLN